MDRHFLFLFIILFSFSISAKLPSGSTGGVPLSGAGFGFLPSGSAGGSMYRRDHINSKIAEINQEIERRTKLAEDIVQFRVRGGEPDPAVLQAQAELRKRQESTCAEAQEFSAEAVKSIAVSCRIDEIKAKCLDTNQKVKEFLSLGPQLSEIGTLKESAKQGQLKILNDMEHKRNKWVELIQASARLNEQCSQAVLDGPISSNCSSAYQEIFDDRKDTLVKNECSKEAVRENLNMFARQMDKWGQNIHNISRTHTESRQVEQQMAGYLMQWNHAVEEVKRILNEQSRQLASETGSGDL